MLLRCRELDSWTQDLSLPSVVWLSGLFNPQSFLTGNSQDTLMYLSTQSLFITHLGCVTLVLQL